MRQAQSTSSWPMFLVMMIVCVGKTLPFASSFSIGNPYQSPPLRRSNGRYRSQHQIRFGMVEPNLEILQQDSSSSSSSSSSSDITPSNKDMFFIDQVGDCIGSGSYGTVHILQLSRDMKQRKQEQASTTIQCIGKRAWQESDLTTSISNPEQRRERATRCRYYWQVEEHCFAKLPPHPQLPPYYGTWQSSNNNQEWEWMVFGIVGEPATSLADYMKQDWEEGNGLTNLRQAMNGTTDDETLDRILDSLLTVLSHVHAHQIVHRDIKPSNLLVHNSSLILLDFGSAADLEPRRPGGWMVLGGGGGSNYWGLEDGNRVAISPIYCAPEVFVDRNRAPQAFDLFSSGLLFCQLLLGYLEERVDAGFHQQLQQTNWGLNLWLSRELASKLRPKGLDDALEYLGDRPGLWSFLQSLLQADPRDRPTAQEALAQVRELLQDAQTHRDMVDFDKIATLERLDGPFFSMVIESMELCELPTVSRPLHFVATFSRRKPLGLVFSEVDDNNSDDDTTDNAATDLWLEATKDALPGEVFIKEVIPGGQADELGIFEIGDRLQGIGELTFSNGGFEKAVEMLQDQPRLAENVKLHFDRIRVRDNNAIPMIPSPQTEITVVDQGVWSTKGRRQTQEDAFVLHEIHDTKDRSVLILGVMDGHGGTAASTKVSQEFPSLVSNQIVVSRRSLDDALLNAWENICLDYQRQCLDGEQCAADYDPREGVLLADTGSEGLNAGTTTSIMAVDETNGQLVALNCGDSRSMVVTSDGRVQLVTQDHTPQTEEERLIQGIAEGLDYSLPKCTFSKWTISAGAYEYAVGRSLEGPFVTSKGIVNDADISKTTIAPGEILVSATDGLWEVMDSDEVALDLYKMRYEQRMNARDAARRLCSLAIRKGTLDNVSVVVVYV